MKMRKSAVTKISQFFGSDPYKPSRKKYVLSNQTMLLNKFDFSIEWNKIR